MRCLTGFIGVALASVATAQTPEVPAETYTNEEEVYFEKEAGRVPPPWIGVVFDNGAFWFIDAFGSEADAPERDRIGPSKIAGQMTLTLADGRSTELRRARPVTCWASLKRDTPKPDGKEDWTFAKDIKLHDQGGRALVGKGEAGVKPVVLRMRNVTWSGSARSTNRPSLVLYVHTADEPDKAVSYVWADPGAARIGVNLRWMQASCTVDGMDKS